MFGKERIPRIEPQALLAAGAITVAAFVSVKWMDGPDPNGCNSRIDRPDSLVTCPFVDLVDVFERAIVHPGSLLEDVPAQED